MQIEWLSIPEVLLLTPRRVLDPRGFVSEKFRRRTQRREWPPALGPARVAAGFCTLTSETLVIYKMTTEYDPEAECGAFWNDPCLAIPCLAIPCLAIPWPVAPEHAVLSEKDRVRPPLAECPVRFSFSRPRW
ncbi:MAG: dTDP-4-dehydrorhamnose 3,5-epimerase family protein [Acetobacteraceae bacterium]